MADVRDTLPGEIWKPVPDYDDRYFVSNLGRVLSMARGQRWLMTPTPARHGYLRVVFRGKSHPVHRLVLSVFDRPPRQGEHGAHLNGNNQDNRLSNLEWVTPVENAAHKRLHGTHQTACSHHAAALKEDQVARLRAMRREGWAWEDLGDHFGINLRTARGIGLGFTYAVLNDRYPPAENHRRMKRRWHKERGADVVCPAVVRQ